MADSKMKTSLTKTSRGFKFNHSKIKPKLKKIPRGGNTMRVRLAKVRVSYTALDLQAEKLDITFWQLKASKDKIVAQMRANRVKHDNLMRRGEALRRDAIHLAAQIGKSGVPSDEEPDDRAIIEGTDGDDAPHQDEAFMSDNRHRTAAITNNEEK